MSLSPPLTKMWPAGGLGTHTVKAFAFLPGTSQSVGDNVVRLYMAGRVPGKPGHWDIVTIAMDQNLSLLWTDRLQNEDDDLPIAIAAIGAPYSLIAVANTTNNGAGSGRDYRVHVLRDLDGATVAKGQYTGPGVHDDLVAGVGVSSRYVIATGTGFPAGSTDGKGKIVTVLFDFNDPNLAAQVLPPFNPATLNDGKSYEATAMSYVNPNQVTSGQVLGVTGTVAQSTDTPPIRDYFTTYYQPDQVLPTFDPLYAVTYDGTGHLDDVPTDIAQTGYVVFEDGTTDSYTWVTGRSQRAVTFDADVVTILYDWTNRDPNGLPGPYHLETRWIARWDRGFHRVNLGNDMGIRLTWDAAIPVVTATGPYIYVVGQSQDSMGFYDYVYLSYDTQREPVPSQELKRTRWVPFGAPLPADCFFGVTNGDSVPSAIAVHYFGCKLMMGTGRSWGGSTADDMVSTLERHDWP